MRFIHEIDDKCQCCGSLNGSRAELTIVCHNGEIVEFEGEPKYIKEALADALDCLTGLLEAAAPPPTPAGKPREEE
ncbi:hypothetical protein LCGC14_1239400 [marine sediment metagenome]|uniref:Uncharacterized protein n=1 Tax=marine sediment metagenome TaxID=412755 RepID=A0A0F9L6I7_9ZZZZ